jgi:capsular polysaccharide biosynthesis protein
VVLLGVTLVFVVASAVFSLLQSPTYTATAVVSVRAGERAGTDSARELVRRVVGGEFSGRVIRESGWEGSEDGFERRLEVAATEGGNDSPELEVSFSAGEPRTAARVANAYAGSFVNRVEELSRDRLAGGSLSAGAELGQKAQPPVSPGSPRPLLYGLAAFGMGLAASAAAVVGMESRTRRWRGAWDAEVALGEPVFGVIPEYDSPEER